MSTVRKLSYRSDLRELERICSDVSAYCREHNVDPDTALALTLCLDELFTNTLKYGYGSAAASGETVFSNEAMVGGTCRNEQSAVEEPTGAVRNLLVEIHLEHHEDHVQVHYHDRGQPFDPFANLSPLPDLTKIAPETLPTSGFGIHLLRKLSSETRYTREGGRNTISLTFSWR